MQYLPERVHLVCISSTLLQSCVKSSLFWFSNVPAEAHDKTKVSQSRFSGFLGSHPTSIKSCQLYLQNIFWMYPLLSIWSKQLLFLYSDNLTVSSLALLKSIPDPVDWKIIFFEIINQITLFSWLTFSHYLSELLDIGPLGITQPSRTFRAL